MNACEFEAVYYNGDVYCINCLPSHVHCKDDGVDPIFADAEEDTPPVCCECGCKHTYMTILWKQCVVCEKFCVPTNLQKMYKAAHWEAEESPVLIEGDNFQRGWTPFRTFCKECLARIASSFRDEVSVETKEDGLLTFSLKKEGEKIIVDLF